MAGPFECETISFEQIDFTDGIFDSVRQDYPDFDLWRTHAKQTSSCRCAFVARNSSKTYAGIAIIKSGEGPDGLSPLGMKISTFKVACEAQALGIADILLSRVFEKALELQVDVVFCTLLPNHEDFARYLELRGFRCAPKELGRGERVYVAEIASPERIYSSINRLAYDLLADEYRARAYQPGPSQEPPDYLAGLLTAALPQPVSRVLELGPGSGSVLSVLTKSAREAVGVEISPNMAAICRENAPQALVVVADILAVDFVENSFDGVYAGAFLHLFPQAEAAKLVSKIAQWTRPGGLIFVNTSVSDHHSASIEIKTDYLHRVARFRSRWTEDEFRFLLEHNGLRITRRFTTDEHERGKLWVAFLCTPI